MIANAPGVQNQDGSEWQLQLAAQISRMNSLDEMNDLVYRMLEDLIAAREEQQTQIPEWVEQVKAYIDEHYVNPSLNIAYVAEQFQMSGTHVGTRFKKAMGISMISSYIHLVRLEHAKVILREGKTLKECSDAVGFADVKTFIRIFKQFEGVTPGKYKKQQVAE